MGDLSHCYTVEIPLTAAQHDRILELVWLLELDPDRDFAAVARRVILDSLDRRLENAIQAKGGGRH